MIFAMLVCWLAVQERLRKEWAIFAIAGLFKPTLINFTLDQWFSTFLSSRHTDLEKSLAAHLDVKKKTK